MSEWKEYKVKEIGEVIGGGTPSTVVKEYWNGDIPWLTPRDLSNYNKNTISAGERYITKLGLANSNAKLLPKGTILLSSRAPIGYLSIAANPIATNQGFQSIVTFKDFDNTFIYYLILSNRDFLISNGEGTTFGELSKRTLRELSFYIPTLTEQKAIASILSSLDDKIDLLNRQNKTLEAIAETLFRQWFVEEADESWEVKRLDELGNIICGKTPSKKITKYFNGEIPFIKIPEMHNNIYVFDTEDSLSLEGKYSQLNKTIPPKSICVSCIATVGLVIMNAYESQTNQQINTLIPLNNKYRYFLFLKLKHIKEDLISMASGGTATDNLNTSNFANIKINMPPDDILFRFHNSIEFFFTKIYNNQQQIRTLAKLRDNLLPKLMSGEVRVKV